MAVPYSTLLFAGSIPAGATTTIFTAPAGRVTVVRDIELANDSTATLALKVGISGFAYFWLPAPLPTETSSQWKGRVVMNVGMPLVVYNEGSQPCFCVASGYLLNA